MSEKCIQVASSFEPLLDSKAAAKLIGIHEKTIQKLARAGKVPAGRIGDLWRFRASELDDWWQSTLHSTPPLVSTKGDSFCSREIVTKKVA